MRRLPVLLATALATVAWAAPALAAAPPAPRYELTTKAPYVPQGDVDSYDAPPTGYQAVFTENVSRHGDRTLTSSSDGDAVLALWKSAQAQGGLTQLGQGLGPEVQRLLDANAAVGYGLLTGSGKRELVQTAIRMEQRLPALFHSAAHIGVVASSQPRTVESAAYFVQGLEAVDPDLTSVIAPTRTDDNLLYFHKAAANKNYQDYLKNDPRLSAAEAAARANPATEAAARGLLLRSFTADFVDRLTDGGYSAEFADDIDAAQAVYNLWAVTADMVDEGPWHMDSYLSAGQASWFGYLDDVDSFYEKGPAFSGTDITYRMAGILLNDMFAQLDRKRAGVNPLSADLRFTHAEEIFPLAALLQLPGSTTQLPVGTGFAYSNDPFRGATVAPMAANIQWDLYRSGNTYLVRMLYNEKQTAFSSTCAPIHPGSYFYNLSTLEHCYGYGTSS